MKIRTKLTTGYLGMILLMVAMAVYSLVIGQDILQETVGRNTMFQAAEIMRRIEQMVQAMIDELQGFAQDPELQTTLTAFNAEFSALEDVHAYIRQQEQAYGNALSQAPNPFMQELLFNETSKALRKRFIEFYERKHGYQVFERVFMTNTYGVNVAQTGRVSKYSHADEAWWQTSKEDGLFLGDVVYDELSEIPGFAIAIRIDDEDGKFIGILRAFLSVTALIKEAQLLTKPYTTTEIQLLTRNGKVLFATSPFKFFEDRSDDAFFKQLGTGNGFFLSQAEGRRELVSYASSKGYGPFKGVDWILVLSHNMQEVLNPLMILRNKIALATVMLVILTVALAVLLSHLIARPVLALRDVTAEIAQGNFQKRIPVTSRDEIGALAAAFNRMIGYLKQSYTALQEEIEVQKQTEETLRASEEAYRTLSQNIPGMIYRGNPDWSADLFFHCEDICGYSPEEFSSQKKNWLDLIHPDDQERVLNETSKLNNQSLQIVQEYRIIDKNGSIRWVEDRKTARFTHQGILDGVDGIVFDITEKKQLEAQLLQSQKAEAAATMARDIIEGMLDAVGLTDREGKIIQCNQAFTELFGGKEEVLGTLLTHFVVERDVSKVVAAIKETFEKEYVKNLECTVLTNDHQEVPVLVNATILRDPEGNPGGLIGVFRDITERKQAEEESKQLNRDLKARTAQLVAANKELKAFSYSVSHDLRAPLRGIDGFSRILVEKYGAQLDDTAKDYLQRVRAATQRMGVLIDDLLRLSRLTRAKMGRKRVDLTALASSIVAELQQLDPGRAVIWDIADGLAVEGDPQLLHVVLENLLGNAWKYTGKHPTARIEFGMVFQGDTPVYFVRDDGAGFDMAYADKLFGAFQRLHGATEFSGNGIGLATVQRIIHRHGGHVWAEAEVEKGATFYFTLEPLPVSAQGTSP
jgi:PAS domain S-box-containing protein